MTDSTSILTAEDIWEAAGVLSPAGDDPVAIEVSQDAYDRVKALFPTAADFTSNYTRLYGLPLRMVDGVGIFRPVYPELQP